jgi:hypothetical protein
LRSGTSTYAVTITRTGNFSGTVSLAATGLASGMRGSFSPSSTTGTSSTFTLYASILPSHKTWTITIKGTSGSTTHTVTLTVSTA